MLFLRFYSICSLHGKGCSQRRSGDTELAAVSEMVRDVTEKRRYDDFNHDANSPHRARLLVMSQRNIATTAVRETDQQLRVGGRVGCLQSREGHRDEFR